MAAPPAVTAAAADGLQPAVVVWWLLLSMPKAKKRRPIVSIHSSSSSSINPTLAPPIVHRKNPAQQPPSPQQRSRQPRPQQQQQQQQQQWRCRSVIDQQAAEALARLLHAAAAKTAGATIKGLTLAPHVVHKKPTFAVTCQALKYLPVLKPLVVRARLVQQHQPQLTEAAAYVLVYELLFGEGFRQSGPAERAVAAAEPDLQGHLRDLLQQHGAPDVPSLLQSLRAAEPDPGGDGGAGAALFAADGSPLQHPRTARVNLLRTSVDRVLRDLQQAARSGGKAAALAATVQVDALLPDVLTWPPGTDLHDHPLVQAGHLILQSKASCLVAHALSPSPGWTVVDCCAAPGNKTTHVAALMGGSGRVLAFDKSAARLQRLTANAERAAAQGCIVARCADFLALDPTSPEFAGVQGVVLDPSCSGSGTGVSRLDHLLPSAALAATAPAAAAAPDRTDPYPQQQQQQGQAARGRKQQPARRRRLQHPEEGDGADPAPQQQLAGGGGPGHSSGDPRAAAAAAEPGDDGTRLRVEQLAVFQEAALLRALRFPALQRLVYSTCSVYRRENEEVVAAALPAAAAAGLALADPFPAWHRRGLPGGGLGEEEAAKLVRTDPAADGTDGFFVAVFQRQQQQQQQQQRQEGEQQRQRRRQEGEQEPPEGARQRKRRKRTAAVVES